MLEQFKKELQAFNGTRLPIAFADVGFVFPSDTRYPNLCVQNNKYGLVSPLEGRTVATIAEIELALRLNVKLKYYDAFVASPVEDGGYIFRDHLKDLIDRRNVAKEAGNELLQQMLKLYVNTLYGKVAQGITPKKGYNINEGKSVELGTSPVSQAYFAAMITGTLRAALSALLIAMDELNHDEGHDYQPISATTDGILYKVGDSTRIYSDSLKAEYRNDVYESLELGDKVFAPFSEVDPVLHKKLEEFAVLRLLQHSRKVWGYDTYLEIKHAVNSVLNFKTRGQIGVYHEA